MRSKTGLLVVVVLLVAVGLAHGQGSCVKCINLDICKSGQCTVQIAKGASCSKGVGPDFATDKGISKALVDGVGAHSQTFAHLLEMLLPKIAMGEVVAGGYIGTLDRTEKTETTFVAKNGEFIFTLDHPVSPDASDGPTRLVIFEHGWKLCRDSSEVASGNMPVDSAE
jgi:hypothetical protein